MIRLTSPLSSSSSSQSLHAIEIEKRGREADDLVAYLPRIAGPEESETIEDKNMNEWKIKSSMHCTYMFLINLETET